MSVGEKNYNINDILPLILTSTSHTIQLHNYIKFDFVRNDNGISTFKYDISWVDTDGMKRLKDKYDEIGPIPQLITNNSSAYLLVSDDRIVKESDYQKEQDKKAKKSLEDSSSSSSSKKRSKSDRLEESFRATEYFTREEGKFVDKYVKCDACMRDCLSKEVKVFGICDHVCCAKCIKKRNEIEKELHVPSLCQCATKECLVGSILPIIKDRKTFKKYCKYYAAGMYDKILNLYNKNRLRG
uniref:RING-type domain-containing protein n=1 Tax=Parastrongyloides trichosuri TaxID=131310 RepID=A0A0N4ZJ33_PARTI